MTTYAELVAGADRAVQRLLGGETVTYDPASGPPVSVIGVFDAQYVLTKGTAEAGIEAYGPAIFFRRVDLPVDPDLDEPMIVISSAPGRPAYLVGNYRVIERRPDDMGGIVLALRKVA